MAFKIKLGSVGVGVFGLVVLSGCGEASEDARQADSNLNANEPSSSSCHSVRDDKDYAVGKTLVGKHDELRCPKSVRICLAPDSNYSSTCRADGTWEVTSNAGFISGGAQ